MSFSPTLFQHHFDIIRVQEEVEGMVCVVHVANLALEAILSDWFPREQRQAVLLQRRYPGFEFGRVHGGKGLQCSRQSLETLGRAVLCDLPVRGNACRGRAGIVPLWESSLSQEARRACVVWHCWRRLIGILQGPDAQPRGFQIALRCGRDATGAKSEKVLVVIVYEQGEWDKYKEEPCKMKGSMVTEDGETESCDSQTPVGQRHSERLLLWTSRMEGDGR